MDTAAGDNDDDEDEDEDDSVFGELSNPATAWCGSAAASASSLLESEIAAEASSSGWYRARLSRSSGTPTPRLSPGT